MLLVIILTATKKFIGLVTNRKKSIKHSNLLFRAVKYSQPFAQCVVEKASCKLFEIDEGIGHISKDHEHNGESGTVHSSRNSANNQKKVIERSSVTKLQQKCYQVKLSINLRCLKTQEITQLTWLKPHALLPYMYFIVT